MDLLHNHKSENLLNPALNSLHDENGEWLSEINFWKDEIAFLYKIIYLKELKHDLPIDEVTEVENQLVYLNHDKLNKFKLDLLYHEQSLAPLYHTEGYPSAEEEKYKKEHMILKEEKHQIYNMIKKVKKDVFSLITNLK